MCAWVAWLLVAVALPAKEFPVAAYGAKGDGTSVDTAAIQKAIDAAAEARGTVVFRPGVFLTGALFLKSGMGLRVDAGVTIRGVQDLRAYPERPTRVAGIEMNWPAALINVYEQKDVKIYGGGSSTGTGNIAGTVTGGCEKSTNRKDCAGLQTTTQNASG